MMHETLHTKNPEKLSNINHTQIGDGHKCPEDMLLLFY